MTVSLLSHDLPTNVLSISFANLQIRQNLNVEYYIRFVVIFFQYSVLPAQNIENKTTLTNNTFPPQFRGVEKKSKQISCNIM